MVTEKTLERINELYHKSKAEGLTDAELAEQKQLRADYVKAFRENLRGQLESIKIKNPDGSLIDVKARHDEKMKKDWQRNRQRKVTRWIRMKCVSLL